MVDRLGYWYGGYLLLSAFFTWLLAKLPILNSLTWPAYILIGIALALITVLTVTASLALFRIFKPISKIQTIDDSKSLLISNRAHDEQSSTSLITTAKKDVTVVDDLETSPPTATDALQVIDERLEQLENHKIQAVNSRIDTLKDMMAINMGAMAEMHDAQAELQFFEPLTHEIKLDADNLSKLPLSKSWHEDFDKWEKKLKHWVTFPEKYHPDKFDYSLAFDHNLLKSEHWSKQVNAIKNSDDSLAYKKFRILLRYFEDNEEKANSIIRYKAWNTFSGQGVSTKYVNRFKY